MLGAVRSVRHKFIEIMVLALFARMASTSILTSAGKLVEGQKITYIAVSGTAGGHADVCVVAVAFLLIVSGRGALTLGVGIVDVRVRGGGSGVCICVDPV